MAMDFHDELGNQLVSLRMYINLLNMQMQQKSAHVQQLIENMEKGTSQLFQGTKDFIWSIDPNSDKVEEIYTYLKDMGDDLFSKLDISFYAELKEQENQKKSEELTVPTDWSRQILLIFKEAMTNSLKHSGCTSVALQFCIKDDQLEICLSDNGTGMTDPVKKGKGLNNMKKRASSIGAELEILPGDTGSVIKFRGNIRS
jgi:signal transduction histidine kinase